MENFFKDFMTVGELSQYLNVSKSFIYKLSSGNILPKYCPNGKLILFRKSEVDQWIGRHRISSVSEFKDDLDFNALVRMRNK